MKFEKFYLILDYPAENKCNRGGSKNMHGCRIKGVLPRLSKININYTVILSLDSFLFYYPNRKKTNHSRIWFYYILQPEPPSAVNGKYKLHKINYRSAHLLTELTDILKTERKIAELLLLLNNVIKKIKCLKMTNLMFAKASRCKGCQQNYYIALFCTHNTPMCQKQF